MFAYDKRHEFLTDLCVHRGIRFEFGRWDADEEVGGLLAVELDGRVAYKCD